MATDAILLAGIRQEVPGKKIETRLLFSVHASIQTLIRIRWEANG
jgi:hypothetical protein